MGNPPHRKAVSADQAPSEQKPLLQHAMHALFAIHRLRDAEIHRE
jgi:hypothetical protein